MTKTLHTVLVYGTLRLGDNSDLVRVNGYLHNLGPFPGFRHPTGPTDSLVLCERITVDDEGLAALDGLEGYREDSPESSMYLRDKIGDDFIYVYNQDLGSTSIIEDGDWLKHTGGQVGSNSGLTARVAIQNQPFLEGV